MVKLSAAAAHDIEDLLDYSIAEFGIQQTENYYDALTRCLELLAENPELGYAAEDIRSGYRRFPHESHVIFYTLDQNDVFVVRILHKRMDGREAILITQSAEDIPFDLRHLRYIVSQQR